MFLHDIHVSKYSELYFLWPLEFDVKTNFNFPRIKRKTDIKVKEEH
jgi:hypothetical protein